MISLKLSYKIAGVSFGLGTLLFLLQLTVGESFIIFAIGLGFMGVAGLVNGIALLVALIHLVKTDYLESFFAMCVLLINIPIAIGYTYILIEFL